MTRDGIGIAAAIAAAVAVVKVAAAAGAEHYNATVQAHTTKFA